MWSLRTYGLSFAIAFALIGLAHSQEPVKEGNPGKPPRSAPIKATLGAPEEPQVADAQARLPDKAPRVTPRLTVREDVGDGVGYSRGYTNFEGFLPIYQSPGEFIIFLDARG